VSRVSRIAFVCGRLEADETTVYTENLVRGFAASGLQVQAVGPGGPLAARIEEAGAPVAVFSLLGKTVVGGLAAARAGAHLYAFGPQLLHALRPEGWPAARRIAKALRIPVVATVHAYVSRPADLPWRASDEQLVIVASESLRENLVNDGGMAKSQIVVVRMGLDLTIYPPKPPERPPSGSGEWGAPSRRTRTVTVGCFSPLEPGAGVDVFIHAAKLVLDAGKDAEFFLAGSGSYEGELRRMASSIGSRGRMTFLGTGIRPEQLMPNLDIFVLPRPRESTGITLLQAMACARPVIGAAAGAVYDVVKDGETGYLFPPDDADALAERMGRLVSASRLRAEMGKAGREKLEREFPFEHMIQQTEAVYSRALDELRPA
jgi:glycosyltransferase involved in cell wall biosynthesis